MTVFFFARVIMSEQSPPIAVFAFNRPDHLRRTLEALSENIGAAGSSVTVFCDGPRSERDVAACSQVRRVAEERRGFRSVEVVERDRNLGCAASVIDGVDRMLLMDDRVVVIEDDIHTAPGTLEYFRRALDEYAGTPSVFSIAAWAPPFSVVPSDYPYSAYFFPRFHCWGWATWRNRWSWNDWSVPGYEDYVTNAFLRKAHAAGGEDLAAMLEAQMRREIDSWAVRAEYTRFMRGCVTLYPRQPLALNIGMDGSGRHCGTSTKYGSSLSGMASPDPKAFPKHICVDATIANRFRRIYRPPGLATRIVSRITREMRKLSGASWRWQSLAATAP